MNNPTFYKAVLHAMAEAYALTKPYGLTPEDLETKASIYAERFVAAGHADPKAVVEAFRKCCDAGSDFPAFADVLKQLAPPIDGSDALPGESWEQYMARRKRQDVTGMPAPEPEPMYRIVNDINTKLLENDNE